MIAENRAIALKTPGKGMMSEMEIYRQLCSPAFAKLGELPASGRCIERVFQRGSSTCL